MANYLDITNAHSGYDRHTPITSSAGSADAEKIAQTDTGGRLHRTVMAKPAVRSVSADTALSESDDILLVDASGGDVTVTLPSATLTAAGEIPGPWRVILTSAATHGVDLLSETGDEILGLTGMDGISGQSMFVVYAGEGIWVATS